MMIRVFLSLSRWPFVVLGAGGFALVVYYALGGDWTTQWPTAGWAAAAVILVFIAISAIHDVMEVTVDRINAPHRPIPAGRITRRVAAQWGGTLIAAGLAIGWLVEPGFGVAITALAAALLVYEVFSRQMGVVKPFLAAALVTCIFPLALVLTGPPVGSRAWCLPPLAVWLSLTACAFELLKDIRDRKGDAQALGQRNLIQQHPYTWMIVASWLIVLAGLALIAPAVLGCRWVYLGGLPILAVVCGKAAVSRKERTKIALIELEGVLVAALTLADAVVFGF